MDDQAASWIDACLLVVSAIGTTWALYVYVDLDKRTRREFCLIAAVTFMIGLGLIGAELYFEVFAVPRSNPMEIPYPI